MDTVRIGGAEASVGPLVGVIAGAGVASITDSGVTVGRSAISVSASDLSAWSVKSAAWMVSATAVEIAESCSADGLQAVAIRTKHVSTARILYLRELDIQPSFPCEVGRIYGRNHYTCL